MTANAATARIHCRPDIKPETRAALIEMMRLALKQFAKYEGPFTVEIIPDREGILEDFNREYSSFGTGQ